MLVETGRQNVLSAATCGLLKSNGTLETRQEDATNGQGGFAPPPGPQAAPAKSPGSRCLRDPRFACIAIYGQTLSHGFINYDDNRYVTENPHVQAGLNLQSIGWAFVTEDAHYIHPLTWMSHMLDCSLYGVHPWGHHLGNLLFHSAASVLLFLALRLLTGAFWQSAAVAALFAVHPLHVESVAWVAERKDVLSALFWMLALGAYGLYVRGGGAVRYAAVAAAFVLGLMSKPMVVTLPFVLLLLDYWPLDRVDRTVPLAGMARKTVRLAAEKIPLFLITALSCASTLIMQVRGNNLASGEKVPYAARCANAIVVYVLYLIKTVWPSGLAVFYPHPIARPVWQVAGAAVVLAAITLFCLRHARRHPYLIVGWLWYLGTLVPVIELVQAGEFSHADRYTYLPSIGVFIMIAWGAVDLAAAWHVPKRAVALASAAALAVLAVCAGVQTAYWRDDGTLFGHAIAVGHESALAFSNVGKHAFEEGRYDEARVCLTKALDLAPDAPGVLISLGALDINQKRYDEANTHLTKALNLTRDDTQTIQTLKNLSALALEQGHADEADAWLRKVLKRRPNNVQALNALGNLGIDKGNSEEARTFLTKALGLEPENAAVLINLGRLALVQERYEEARTCLTKALNLNPRNVSALNNLGACLLYQGQYEEARRQILKALEIDPQSVSAMKNMSYALTKLGWQEEADAYSKKAAELGKTQADGKG